MVNLRNQQNLLVTGIMFPAKMAEADRIRFEAKLFLEINANQTTPKSDLKQEIGLLLKPYSPDSIARKVMNSINDGKGPLNGLFVKYFFDKSKLKTTTIVSYGIVPLVRIQEHDTLFQHWTYDQKVNVAKGDDSEGLENYIKYCSKNLDLFFAAIRAVVSKEKWTVDKKAGGILNTTFTNGVISLFRRLVKLGKIGSFEYYIQILSELEKFDFNSYKSSQYNQMGEALFSIISTKIESTKLI
ncbi:hypothetical protein [Methylobacterium sp. Leaf125]|uniref:hypothetical protein n=1 Tax=Methylobacterium sp. Leaf125 TaxID=1736265 RepID=UPI000A3D9C7E|nr:hypothetical protein [Methylobacterium sp. Leaf125]